MHRILSYLVSNNASFFIRSQNKKMLTFIFFLESPKVLIKMAKNQSHISIRELIWEEQEANLRNKVDEQDPSLPRKQSMLNFLFMKCHPMLGVRVAI